jgi:hypothetical protein
MGSSTTACPCRSPRSTCLGCSSRPSSSRPSSNRPSSTPTGGSARSPCSNRICEDECSRRPPRSARRSPSGPCRPTSFPAIDRLRSDPTGRRARPRSPPDRWGSRCSTAGGTGCLWRCSIRGRTLSGPRSRLRAHPTSTRPRRGSGRKARSRRAGSSCGRVSCSDLFRLQWASCGWVCEGIVDEANSRRSYSSCLALMSRTARIAAGAPGAPRARRRRSPRVIRSVVVEGWRPSGRQAHGVFADAWYAA